MLRLFSLCLWQAMILGVVLTITPSAHAQEAGIQIRGPKSTDAFPYRQYGPITSSDTLWKIAATVRPNPTVSIYQVMQALYEMNPEAFANNNRNHLINGQYLQIPSIEKIRMIDPYQAKSSSARDDKNWKTKTQAAKVAKQQPVKPEELSVKKKDLDAAKVEINEQLKTFDEDQQQRLDTIQRDVLDSIDGLQAILRENEELKKRQLKFNEQIDLMKEAAVKDKQEVKETLDALLALQQELAAREEERERQLLLEKQQAELEAQNWMSSLWFKVLMGTLPALLIAGGIWAFIARKKKQDKPQQETKTETKEVAAEPTAEDAEAPAEASEELSLDGELSLDDELSIDLTESDDESDDLFSDNSAALDDNTLLDDDLSDDVIHLDDDLDELDDLEDISLDDDLVDDEPLEGGELDQGDLDALLSGDDDSEPLEGGELDQNDLDDLLSGLDDDDSEPLEGGELGQDDLDALLSESASEEDDELPDAVDDESAESDQATDEVDIDAIDVDTIEDNADVTDPDDIDALLASANMDAEGDTGTDDDVVDIEDGADVTDPDDIDALLASVGGADNDAADNTEESSADPVADIADGADVTDPDDIDALLASVGGADSSAEDSTEEASADSVADIADGADVTDPDDIDALLASVGGAESDAEESTEEESADPVADIADGADVTDPDDIDALLASINGETSSSTAEEISADSVDIEDGTDVTNPDDIDALLASVNGDDVAADTLEDEAEITDPDDIDALLDNIGGVAAAASVAGEVSKSTDDVEAGKDEAQSSDTGSESEKSDNQDQIEAFTEEYVAPFLSADFSELLKDPDEASDGEDLDVTDSAIEPENDSNLDTELAAEEQDFDIDELIESVEKASSDEMEALDISEEELAGELNADELENYPEIEDILSADLAEDDEQPRESPSIDETEELNPKEDNTNEGMSDELSDELNIDDLIADIQSDEREELDIGDDLLAGLEDATASDQELDFDLEEIADEKEPAPSDFDESTLSDMLSEEKDDEVRIELSPDFTDTNVLSDLLDEGDSTRQEVSEANEIDDIQELDSLDFDELLANIEEETATNVDDSGFDITDGLDIGDDIAEELLTQTGDVPTDVPSSTQSNAASSVSNSDNETTDDVDDFVSVDSLLSESLDAPSLDEPYEQTNIDVGLSEFPEFASAADQDEDDNGVAAKLDLAKVYLEIGDKDNAEIILQDVVKLGDPQQQFEAQQLLDNM